MPRHLLPLAGAVAFATAAAAFPTASTAATPPPPTRPSGVHLITATSSSVTVGAAAGAHVTRYRAYASTVKSDVYVANISRAKASGLSATPRLTVSGFRYTTAPVYYRLQVFNGKRMRWDLSIHSAGLRPSTPTGIQAHAPSSGPYLTWQSTAGTGYLVYQSTTEDMSANRRVYRVSGRGTTQLSPYGLVAHHTYYFRIRAVNHGTASGYSDLVAMTVKTRQQPIDVMTYNVLEGTTAGMHEGGNVIASWSRRRPGVVRLIRGAMPDVVAVQEAAAWYGTPHGFGGRRQVDNLRDALGGDYTLAYTETPPSQHYYLRTGNYILYRQDRWLATSTRGHWNLDSEKTAAYQVLKNRRSGARVLVISAHLAVGNGASADARRQNETEVLVSKAKALAAGRFPIVYAGDFNSNRNKNHVFDGAGQAMQAAGIVDAERVAQVQRNKRYNTSNLYMRTPPAVDQNIDYVFASPGVAVYARSVLLNLSHGRFVGVIPSDHNPLVTHLYVSYNSAS
jgi:endonuclease/exonuclease/phosphatase family metal-dependent hydrolase